ncbi:MAG: hypothetical protein MR270_06940 [Erysipelotrichaceae bacterium]|nr:hypothetical protein [Erysipelotrichaceae bacterium]
MKRNYVIFAILLAISSCNISDISNENSESIDTSHSFSNDESSIISSESINNEDVYFLKDPNFLADKKESKDEFTYTDLFNLNNKVDIKITISDSELNELQKSYETGYKSEIYRVADKVELSITNYNNTFTWTYLNVGIRQKGNTSRKDVLIDGNINNQNHFKLSFDETFDDNEMYSSDFIASMKEKIGNDDYSSREFLGLSGLDFKWNKNNDPTHIKEVYASNFYLSGGIMCQHIGLSTVSMIRKDKNNEETSFGLCTLYEPGSKSLIKRSLSSDTSYVNCAKWSDEKNGTYGVSNAKYGDFYKCTYGINEGSNSDGADMTLNSITNKKVGIGNISGSYIPTYERKTNTNVNYDDKLLINAINTINNSTYEEIEKVVDLKYLAKEQALSYFVGNPDDLRINSNNYLLYFRRIDGKMIILPYDLDRCFGITKDYNFDNGLTTLKPLSLKSNQGQVRSPLLLKTTLSSTSNTTQKDYLKMIEIIKNSMWVKNETFLSLYDIAKKTYSEYDFSLSNENMSFEEYIDKKILATNDEDINNDIYDTKIYDNLYIVGNFNDWGNYSSEDLPVYKFNYLGDYTYEVEIIINNELSNNTLQFKINAGQNNWSDIDWSLSEDLTTLIKKKDGNAILYDVYKGDVIKVTINTYYNSSKVVKIS